MYEGLVQGIQRGMVFRIFEIKCFWFVVAICICDLVHRGCGGYF